MQETLESESRFRSLGGENPIEEEMEPQHNILAWGFPQTEEPGGLQSAWLQKSWTRLKQLSKEQNVA